MQLPPESVIESWPPPNYVDPTSRGPGNIIVQLILYPLVFIIVALRIYTRLRLSKSFGADDVLILCALVPTSVFMLLTLLGQMRWGLNHHVWDLELDKITMILKISLTADCIFAMACTFTKLSMLAMVRRIMSVSNRLMDKVVIGVMTFIAAQGFVFCIIVIFQCRPPSDFWKLSVTPQPNCINQIADILAAGIINTVTDFIVVIIPIPTVYRLKLRSRQRTIVIVLFAIGFLVCFAGAARTVFTYKFLVSYDGTWAVFPVWITSTIELYVGIICASIPPTRPFFLHHVPGFLISNAISSHTTHLQAEEGKVSSQGQQQTPKFEHLDENQFEIVEHRDSLSEFTSAKSLKTQSLTLPSGTNQSSPTIPFPESEPGEPFP